ncbi:MAG: hypothetical protein RR676_14770, partial [Acinetobacter sp.]
DSTAVRLNYAKGYACGSEGFLKAIAFSQIYAKRSARGSRAFKMQRILPILRHEQVLKCNFKTKCKMLAAVKKK